MNEKAKKMLICLILTYCFLRLATSCLFLGEKYDPDEHTFLCKQNLTISDKIIKDIKGKEFDEDLTPEEFANLAKEMVDDLMLKFRESAVEMYEKYTCVNNLCHPSVAKERRPQVADHLPRFASLSSVDLLETIVLSNEISDLDLMQVGKDVYLSVVFETPVPVSFLRYTDRGFHLIPNVIQFSGTCLTTTSNRWTPSLVVEGNCHRFVEEIDKPFEPYVKNNFTYVLRVDDEDVKMIQMLDSKKSPLLSLKIFWQRGIPNLLLLTEDGNGFLHGWDGYEFKLDVVSQFLPASDITTFEIGSFTYLVFSDFKTPAMISPLGVYVYRSDSSKPLHFELYQRLTSCSPVDSQHFSLSDLHFLAVACDKDNLAYIYWWSGNQFFIWQTIPVHKALTWTSVRLANREIVLILIDLLEFDVPVMKFFQYEENYFEETDITVRLSRLPSSVTSFSSDGSTILLVAGSVQRKTPPSVKPEYLMEKDAKSLSVYKINVKPKEKKMKFRYHDDEDLYKCVENVRKRVDEERMFFDALQIPSWDLIHVDQKEVITGSKTFVNGIHGKDVHVENLHFASNVVVEPDRDEHFDCGDCEMVEMEIEQKLRLLNAELDDVVLKSKPQVVTGKKIINNLIVKHELHSDEVLTGPICDVDLQQLQRNSLRKSGDQMINISTTIYGELTINHVEFRGLINGIHLKDIATVYGGQQFVAPQVFDRIIVDRVEISGKLNEIRPRDIVVNEIPQVIRGQKRIVGNVFVTGRLNIMDKIDNVDLAKLAKSILTVDTMQEIENDVVFEGDVDVEGNVLSGSVDQQDLTNFYSRVLNTNEEQKITGSAIFDSNLEIIDRLVSTTVNGIDLLRDVLTTDTEQIIKHPVTITNEVIVDADVHVDDKINGISWPSDVVFLLDAQKIIGYKTFLQDRIDVRNVIVFDGGLINGVDLSEIGYPFTTAAHDVSVGELNVEFINGKSVRQLLNVLRTSTRQNLTGKFVFHDVTVHEVFVKGLVLEEQFITLTTEQIIEEEVEFVHGTRFLGSVHMKDGTTINGRDLSEIASSAVSVDGDYVIRGHKTFVGDVRVEGDVAFEKGTLLNGLDVSEHLLLVNKEQTINVAVEVENMEVENEFHVVNSLKTTTINEINVNEFVDRAVFVRGEHVLHGTKDFQTDVNVYHQLNVHLINKHDLKDVQEHIVRLSTVQKITGDLMFEEMHFEAPSTVTTLNGMTLTKELSHLVVVSDHGHVTSPVSFRDCVHFEKNVHIDVLNDVVISFISDKMLSKSREQTLSFQRTFDGSIVIENLIASRVDDILLQELILINESVRFNKPVKFTEQLTFDSDVTFVRVNDVHLNELIGKSVTATDDVVILEGPKLVTRLEVKEMIVDGFINGINITDLERRLVQRNKQQVITGKVIFKKDVTVDRLETTATINKINVNHLMNVAVTRRDEQEIKGKKTFVNIEIRDDVIVRDSIVNVGLIDGADLSLLEGEAVRRGVDEIITSELVFEENVTLTDSLRLSGSINGINLDQVLLVDENQTIEGTVEFVTLEVDELTVAGLVNDINLTHLITHRMTLFTEQEIDRSITFDKEMTIIGDVTPKSSMNGLRCEDIVTVHTDQVIFGKKTFVDVIFEKRIVADYVNDVHWLALYNQVEQFNKKTWIHHEDVVFHKKIILSGGLESHERAHLAASQLMTTAHQTLTTIKREMIDFNHWFNDSHHCLLTLKPKISALSIFLDYFDWLQYLQPSSHLSVVPLHGHVTFFLVSPLQQSIPTIHCSNLLIYTCSDLPNPCVAMKKTVLPIPQINLEKINYFAGNRVSFLVLETSMKRLQTNCPTHYFGTYVISFLDDRFPLLQIRNETLDGIAILPGHPDSLLVTVAVNSSLLTVQHIHCTEFTCSLGPVEQELELFGATTRKLQWFVYKNLYHLLVLNKFNVTTRSTGVLSFILRWDHERGFVKSHSMFTVAAMDATVFVAAGQTYVAIGSYDCWNDLASDRLRIYRITDKEVEIVQEIPFSVRSVIAVTYLDETYLMVSHVEEDVFVYRWTGYFGFQKWSKLNIPNPQSIHYFLLERNLFLIVAANEENNKKPSSSKTVLVMGKTSGPLSLL